MTPTEQRDEQRDIDGDVGQRRRRQRLAREWINSPNDVLEGASLVLTGENGLTVVVAGDPPPGRVTVRMVARGAAASNLRRSAERASVPVVRAPRVAGWMGRPGGDRALLSPDLAARLTAIWPASTGAGK